MDEPPRPAVSSGPRLAPCRAATKRLLDSATINVIMFFATIFVLFGDDVRLAFLDPTADDSYFAIASVVLFAFIIEIILQSVAKPEYLSLPKCQKPTTFREVLALLSFGSFYFWLDVIATASLVPEVSVCCPHPLPCPPPPPLLHTFLPSIAGLVLQIPWIAGTEDSAANENIETARAGRASRAGARAGRVVRFIRLVRILRIVKVYKYAREIRANRMAQQREAAAAGGQERDKAAGMEESGKETVRGRKREEQAELEYERQLVGSTRVGTALSDLT